MLTNVSGIEQLMQLVSEDKTVENSTSFVRDRYPLRFVLFDNFEDCTDFVCKLMDEDVKMKSVEDWIDKEYPDILITFNQLAESIQDFVQHDLPSDKDCVITPFSELARFYENSPRATFESLVRTIKGIEATGAAWEHHQRVYIPIVGLDGKMQAILPDTQITLWKVNSPNKTINYRMILTDDTYEVSGLEERYSIVHNVNEWLKLWKNPETNIKTDIICTSQAILSNANYAQPDNAFDYKVCDNVHKFLVDGLKLDFGALQYKEADDTLWKEMARCIDLSEAFDFDNFVANQFSISSIDDYKAFIKIWFDNTTEFDRWLLAGYYLNKHDDYISQVLRETPSYIDADFFRTMAMQKTSIDSEMKIRRYCLNEAESRGVRLRNDVESLLRKQDIELAKQQGHRYASSFFTAISTAEKKLAIQWIGDGLISPSDVKESFPALKDYMGKSIGTRKPEQTWVLDYIDKYKSAKIKNDSTESVDAIISERNKDEVSFYNWFNQFSTTRTLLQSRTDIEVFYWIDGLGVDWIPFITSFVEKYNSNGIYLNEVMIARAILPTITPNNKAELQLLAPDDITLNKKGDLDALAHKTTNVYPDYIIEEIEIVSTALKDILQKYNGKKIAIVSDHGLSYLPQRSQKHHMAGVTPHHHGRYAIKSTASLPLDNHYTILDDGTTLCALGHQSLCEKTPDGLGAHGGCTPEEVLVPIFIISPQKEAAHFSSQIVNPSVSAANPVVEFIINNLPVSSDVYVEYAGKRYEVAETSKTHFKTTPLVLDANYKELKLHVGSNSIRYQIDFTLAVDMDDDILGF